MRLRSILRSELVLVLGMLAFVGGVWGIEQGLSLSEPVALSMLPALALAAVPALLWLAFFYRQDLHEPEPLHYVTGIFLLGALVAHPAAMFLEGLTRASEWCLEGRGMLIYAGGSILTFGLAQEFSKYAVVRYTVYYSDEFDEPVDGIVYMTAAGLGFATRHNFEYLTSAGGIYLTVGTVNVVVTTLAHACFAAITGYFMGNARCGGGRLAQLQLLAGVLVAATANAVFGIAHDQLLAARDASIVEHTPALWTGLALYGVAVIVVFGVIFMLMRRHVEASPHKVSSS